MGVACEGQKPGSDPDSKEYSTPLRDDRFTLVVNAACRQHGTKKVAVTWRHSGGSEESLCSLRGVCLFDPNTFHSLALVCKNRIATWQRTSRMGKGTPFALSVRDPVRMYCVMAGVAGLSMMHVRA